MQDNSALGRALEVVKDLRRRCPWDRIQTRETLRPYLLEEVFELEHALSEEDPIAIRDEVADLLLHLAWQLVLAEEKEEFTADEVATRLEQKMRRRHPHLYDLGPAEEWEALKRRERREGRESRERREGGVLAGLPPALPGLLLAYRLQQRAATVGFDWPDAAGPAAKVREELAEVERAVRAGEAGEGGDRMSTTGEPVHPAPSEAIVDEIGDLLFAVVNLARKVRVQPHLALERANRKFRVRFEAIETVAAERGIDMPTAGLEVLDGLWEEAKKRERPNSVRSEKEKRKK